MQSCSILQYTPAGRTSCSSGSTTCVETLASCIQSLQLKSKEVPAELACLGDTIIQRAQFIHKLQAAYPGPWRADAVYTVHVYIHSMKKSTSEHLFWCFRWSQIDDSIQYLEGPNGIDLEGP